MVPPMFTEDVCRILGTLNMVEYKDASRDGFLDMVERQIIVLLVEFGMWDGGAIHNGLVISKHVGLPPDRNTKVAQSGLEVDGLVHTDSGCYEL